jgi:hypothetical protein
MDEFSATSPVSDYASIFREEARRARRYAAAIDDKKVYEELAAGQDLGPTDRD